MIPRLKTLYHKEVKTMLKEKYGFKNLNMAPKFEKVVLNMGLGIDGNDSKIFKSCEEDLAKIAGQKPVSTKFKKSISNFGAILRFLKPYFSLSMVLTSLWYNVFNLGIIF